MRLFLFLGVFSGYMLSAYEQGKIDMHGGKEAPLYEKKKDFQVKSFGVAAFRDTNATQKSKPTKK